MRNPATLLLLVITSLQTPDVAFEVASVKPNTTGSQSSSISTPPNGRFTAVNVTARSLIVNAYRMRSDQVVGGPGWLETERFDVAARPPEGSLQSLTPLMLRAMLKDRFKLAIHMETREQPIYALVLARADGRLGPQLTRSTLNCPEPGQLPPAANSATPRPPAAGDCGVNMSVSRTAGTIKGGGRSIARLVDALDSQLDRPLLDRTGLTGTFDFELRFSNESLTSGGGPVPAATDGPTLFTAMQEQLGLKVDSQRGPVELLVIDGVERPGPD